MTLSTTTAGRLVLFAVGGIFVENLFTGLYALGSGDYAATTQSYLWMLPIYAGGGELLWQLQREWRNVAVPLWARLVIGVYFIFVVELASGWALQQLLGRCPWDYGDTVYSVYGLINLGYAPFWAVLAGFVDYFGHRMEAAT